MWAIILIVIGFFVIIFTAKTVELTGEISCAEKYLGAGGTYTFVKIIGLLLIFIGFGWLTGGLQQLLMPTFGIFFGNPNPHSGL